MQPAFADQPRHGARAFTRIGADRRRFRRVDMNLAGRLMDEAGDEFPCRSVNVSPGSAWLDSPLEPKSGAKLIIYLDEFGRMPATVCRAGASNGFAVEFDITRHKKERLAEVLTWRINAPALNLTGDQRRTTRYAKGGPAEVVLDDGSILACEVLDFSLVGVALATQSRRPDLGRWVRVGATYGKVARYFEGGFAVDFETPGR